MTTVIEPSRLNGCVLVMAAFLLMYYTFMQLGPSARSLNKSAAQILWGTRSFGNLHEQSPAFLLAFWMHALLVSPEETSPLGVAWLAFRAAYPLIWMVEGGFSPRVLVSTMPGYGICSYLMMSTVSSCVFGVSLRATLFGHHAIGVVLATAFFWCQFQLSGTINGLVAGFFAADRPGDKRRA